MVGQQRQPARAAADARTRLSSGQKIFGRTVPQALLVTAALVLYSAAILFVWLNFAQHAFEWLPYNNYLWD